jgi:hypothetical protein
MLPLKKIGGHDAKNDGLGFISFEKAFSPEQLC